MIWPDQVFNSNLRPSEAIVGAIIENMILPDLVLCYVPQVLEKKIGKKLKSLHSLGGKFREFFLKKGKL